MPKILIAECMQEVSSFNPVPSHYEDYTVRWGDALLDFHRSRRSEVGAALQVFAEAGADVYPTYSARTITSGGTLAEADWRQLADEFLTTLAQAPHPFDGIYFCLHGAMSAQGEDDPEGYLLQEARKIVGERVPLVVSLDLHGILTDRMLRHADAIVVYHTYPHVDFYQTGERAARLLLRIMAGEARPVTAVVPIPALVRGDELITATGLFGRSIRAAQAIEAGEGGLSAGMFIGNPFTDVAELRSNSLVVLNGDEDRARREALQLATDFWAVRERLQARLTPLDEAVRIAHATPGTTILVDAADAPSSGASGDSNAILRRLVETGYGKRALLPLVDPEAVRAAMQAGIGQTVRVSVGGAFDRRFTPLPVEARVRLLSDGVFLSERQGDVWKGGDSAVLEAGSITLVVTSRPVNLFDRALFWAHGQEPRRFDAVVVKSPHCEPQMFAEWASALVNVDAPGATSANLPSLGHTQCARPIWPLEADTPFEPVARIYRRR
ncbi:MAG: M81 family metallopeptidase [Anaerolineae bacterium]|nr:M81 family metallopeptidase [Anaerolineae bacterium]